MYLDNWDDFQKAAEDIYIASPARAAKYKTKQSTDLKKFIGLNRALMSKMQNIEHSEGNSLLETNIPLFPKLITFPSLVAAQAPENVVSTSQPTTASGSVKQGSGKNKKSKKNRK
ncbi:hypothetical protein Unana1_05755 [Umbelopsis nana]